MKVLVDRFDIERIAALYEAQNYEKCNDYVKSVCERLGRTTPWLNWVRGVCEDMLGNPFEGLHHFKQALESDPYNFTYMQALHTNLNMFKNGLLSALEREGGLQYVETVHKCLVEAGEFTSTHQYLVIKNYIKHKKFREAQDLLHGFLTNNPNDLEALALEKLVDECSTKLLVS